MKPIFHNNNEISFTVHASFLMFTTNRPLCATWKICRCQLSSKMAHYPSTPINLFPSPRGVKKSPRKNNQDQGDQIFIWGRKCEFLCRPLRQVRSYKKQTLDVNSPYDFCSIFSTEFLILLYLIEIYVYSICNV